MVVPNIILSRSNVFDTLKAVAAADEISNVCSILTRPNELILTVSDSFETTVLRTTVIPTLCEHMGGRIYVFTSTILKILQETTSSLPLLFTDKEFTILDPVTLQPLPPRTDLMANAYDDITNKHIIEDVIVLHTIPMHRGELCSNIMNLSVLSGKMDFQIDHSGILTMCTHSKSYGCIRITKALNLPTPVQPFQTCVIIKFVKAVVNTLMRKSTKFVNVTCRTQGSVGIEVPFGDGVSGELLLCARLHVPPPVYALPM